MSESPTKRAKIAEEKTSCPLQWPEDLSEDKEILNRYLDPDIKINRFVYALIIIKTNDTNDTLTELKKVGAFSSSKGREALLEMIKDVRETGEYTKSTCCLDTLEHTALYAFSLEDDKLTVGCGKNNIPSPEKPHRVLIDCLE